MVRPMSSHIRPPLPVVGLLSALLMVALAVPAGAKGPGMTTPGTPAPPTTASATRPAADPTPTPQPRYRFIGFGTDHGVGFSQRGAAGRAAAGQDHAQILAHYFARTTLGYVAPSTTIRALVVRSYLASKTETRLVRGSVTSWRIDGTDPRVEGQVFKASYTLVLLGRGATGAWHLQVRNSAGDVRADFIDPDAKLTVVPVAPAGPGDPVGAIQVLIRPSTRYDTYQGAVRIGRAGGRIRVVNVVPIEAFVRSVAPQEMGPANLPEALGSQAIVTRSYFLAGLSTKTGFLAYDVESYRDSQSYKGRKSEKAATTQATDATAYQVVVFRGTAPAGTRLAPVLMGDSPQDAQPDPSYYVARTFYHAVGGGATEASQNVFTTAAGKVGSRTPYLKGGPDVDPDGVPYDAGAPAFAWTTRSVTLAELSAILAKDSRTNVGQLTSWPIGKAGDVTTADPKMTIWGESHGSAIASASNRGVSGRLIYVVLHGNRNGKDVTKRVAGWLFESVFNTHRGSGDPIGSTMIYRVAVP